MQPTTVPTLVNTSLLHYVEQLDAQYPNAEFYKEERPDSGRDEGPTLWITTCQDDEILAEENFYYANQADLQKDLENLAFYLDFS